MSYYNIFRHFPQSTLHICFQDLHLNMPSVANSLRTYVFSDLLEQDGFVHPESMFDLLINIKDKDGKVNLSICVQE